MADVLINENTMTNIANSIRNKSGKTNKMLPNEMPNEIDNITSNIGYNVKFNVDNTPYQVTSVKQGGKVNEPVAPVKKSSLFNGWKENENIVSFPYIPNKNITLNASFLSPIFYAPMDKKSAKAVTGQDLVFDNDTAEYVVDSNIPCCNLKESGLNFIVKKDFLKTGVSCSISFWIKSQIYSGSSYATSICCTQGGGETEGFNIYQAPSSNVHSNTVGILLFNQNWIFAQNSNGSKWNWVCLNYDGNKVDFFVNKTKAIVDAGSNIIDFNGYEKLFFGIPNGSSAKLENQRIAGIRVYDRVLSESQQTQLFNEFQPTDQGA